MAAPLSLHCTSLRRRSRRRRRPAATHLLAPRSTVQDLPDAKKTKMTTSNDGGGNALAALPAACRLHPPSAWRQICMLSAKAAALRLLNWSAIAEEVPAMMAHCSHCYDTCPMPLACVFNAQWQQTGLLRWRLMKTCTPARCAVLTALCMHCAVCRSRRAAACNAARLVWLLGQCGFMAPCGIAQLHAARLCTPAAVALLHDALCADCAAAGMPYESRSGACHPRLSNAVAVRPAPCTPQLAVYGKESMRRMATANVLICGLGGLGVEVGERGCCHV